MEQVVEQCDEAAQDLGLRPAQFLSLRRPERHSWNRLGLPFLHLRTARRADGAPNKICNAPTYPRTERLARGGVVGVGRVRASVQGDIAEALKHAPESMRATASSSLNQIASWIGS